MELKRLKHFVAAARELSFSGAARKMGVSQPVLSRSIKELETQLGAQLFFRSTTDVSLTPAGEALFSKASQALQILDEAMLSVRQIGVGRESRLEVAYLPLLLDAFVATALETVRQSNKGVCLRPHEMSTQRQIDSLRAGNLDIAIVAYYEGDEFDKDFDLFDICETDMAIVVSSKDPVASMDAVPVESILGYELVGYSHDDFPNCNNALERYFRMKQLPFNPILHVNSSQSTMAAVAAGGAYTFMSMFGRLIESKHVSFVSIDPPDFRIRFGALVKRGENRRVILEFLHECRRVAQARLAEDPILNISDNTKRVALA